ncbi:SMC-Scp complex subunit ScpB [Micromonospora zhanjiangensis]
MSAELPVAADPSVSADPSVPADPSTSAEPSVAADVGSEEPGVGPGPGGAVVDAPVDAADEPAAVQDHEPLLDPTAQSAPEELPVPADRAGTGEDRPDRTPSPAGTPLEPPAGTPLDPLADDDEFRAALEAILLVVDEPVAEIVLAQVLEQPTDRVAAVLERISRDYTEAGHGFDLRRAAGGWRLYTRPEYASYVERFVLDGQSVRLTQAALETLAVVAYKQPVTRSRISAIRGVNCDGVIRTLVTRGLVAECGAEPDTGAFLYRTTPLFLEKLGLDTVDELPPLAPFLPDDVEEIADAPR